MANLNGFIREGNCKLFFKIINTPDFQVLVEEKNITEFGLFFNKFKFVLRNIYRQTSYCLINPKYIYPSGMIL